MTIPATRYYRTIPDHPVVNSLPAAAQALLGWMFRHLNAQTLQLNPRQETLSREMRCSLRSCQRAMRILKAAGIIRTFKARRSSRYEIREVADWHPIRPATTRTNHTCRDICVATKMSYLKPPILNEEETFSSEEETAAADALVETTSSSGGGGGDVPAARETPTPKPTPTPSHERRKQFSHPGKMVCEERNSAKHPSTPVEKREVEQLTLELVEELLPHHPVSGNASRAATVLSALLEREPGAGEAIRHNHARFQKLWTHFKPGRFIPQLWRWVQDNDWRYPPTDEEIRRAMDPDALRQLEIEERQAKEPKRIDVVREELQSIRDWVKEHPNHFQQNHRDRFDVLWAELQELKRQEQQEAQQQQARAS